MEKSFIQGTEEERWGYSPAVVTDGGRVVWVAGHASAWDEDGNSLEGDFGAQARQTFKDIGATLAKAGGRLEDIVTMTVYLVDANNARRMTEIRKEILATDFPASALIVVKGLARPEMMIEIQAIAVLPD